MRRTGLRASIAVGLILILLIAGTLVYRLIEVLMVTEILYMTVITLTTVGFGEVLPLSTSGQHFTILFLAMGIATVGYSLSIVLSYLFEGQIVSTLRGRRMERQLRRMHDHYIVCGAGDIGREVVKEFRTAGTRFVVVERDPEHSELASDDDTIVVRGDASEEETLRSARIEHARGLIAVLPSDVDNVFVTLTARQLNTGLSIIAKGTDVSATSKLRRAGADRVITPSTIAGRRIASSILRPSVVNFLDVIVDDTELAMRMDEYIVAEDSSLAGRSLREADIGQHTGAIVLAIMDQSGSTRTDATRSGLSSVTIHPRDRIIGLGSEEQLRELERLVEHGS